MQMPVGAPIDAVLGALGDKHVPGQVAGRRRCSGGGIEVVLMSGGRGGHLDGRRLGSQASCVIAVVEAASMIPIEFHVNMA
jgi:hypothetical protein